MPEISGKGNHNKDFWFSIQYWVELLTLAKYWRWKKSKMLKYGHESGLGGDSQDRSILFDFVMFGYLLAILFKLIQTVI